MVLYSCVDIESGCVYVPMLYVLGWFLVPKQSSRTTRALGEQFTRFLSQRTVCCLFVSLEPSAWIRSSCRPKRSSHHFEYEQIIPFVTPSQRCRLSQGSNQTGCPESEGAFVSATLLLSWQILGVYVRVPVESPRQTPSWCALSSIL